MPLDVVDRMRQLNRRTVWLAVLNVLVWGAVIAGLALSRH
jgi:hypothetical protein